MYMKCNKTGVLLICLGLLTHGALYGQEYGLKYKYWTIGGHVGTALYGGELTPSADNTFPSSQLGALRTPGISLGFQASYHFDPQISLRGTLSWYRIWSEDRLNPKQVLRNRNLHFENDLLELSLQVVYEYLPTRMSYLYRPRVSPYVFAGVGVFYTSPYSFTDVAGRRGQTAMRELRTEGQATAYGLWALSLPFGVGVRYTLRDRWNIALEFGLRWTNTDALDDVTGAGPNAGYPTAAQLDNDPTRIAFSFRGINGLDPTTAKRGTPNTNDWFGFVGVNVNYVLFQPKCPKPTRQKRGGVWPFNRIFR